MSYDTKQRKTIIEFFNDNIDKIFSVEEIFDALKNKNISLSAIYRNLAELEKSNKVRIITKVGTNKKFYQFIDNDDCKGHIHLLCKNCGKSIHLNDEESHKLTSIVLKNTNFEVFKSDSVLYGICGDCKSLNR